MQEQTLTERAKEAIVSSMEKEAARGYSNNEIAALSQTYAAILEAEAKQHASSVGTKLLEEVKSMNEEMKTL